MRWINNKWHLFDGNDELYHHAKFGEDRTMRAGCGCENVVFFVCLSRSESGAPCVREVHSSNKLCVAVYWPISMRFHPFFRMDYSFRCTTQFSHSLLDGATIFTKLRSKLRKVQKSAEKFVRTTSYRRLRDLKKIPPQQMCTYIKIFAHVATQR